MTVVVLNGQNLQVMIEVMAENNISFNLIELTTFSLKQLTLVEDSVHLCVVVQFYPWFDFYVPLVLYIW